MFRLSSWDSSSKTFQIIREGRLPNVDSPSFFPLQFLATTASGDICVSSFHAVLCMSSQFYDSDDMRFARVYNIAGITSLVALPDEAVILVTCTAGVMAIRWPSLSSSSPQRVYFGEITSVSRVIPVPASHGSVLLVVPENTSLNPAVYMIENTGAMLVLFQYTLSQNFRSFVVIGPSLVLANANFIVSIFPSFAQILNYPGPTSHLSCLMSLSVLDQIIVSVESWGSVVTQVIKKSHNSLSINPVPHVLYSVGLGSESSPLSAANEVSVEFQFYGVMLRPGSSTCFLRLLNRDGQYVNLIYGQSSVEYGEGNSIRCSVSNWHHPAGKYEVSFVGINGTVFVHVVPFNLSFSLSVLDIHTPPLKFSLLGFGLTPELCSGSQLFVMGLTNRSFCILAYTSINECRCDVFDPDASFVGPESSIYRLGHEAFQIGTQMMYWNVSSLASVFIGYVRFALINHPPVVNVSLFLVANDVDCVHFSRNVGKVSPGIPAESSQSLSVKLHSYTSAVRQFVIPVGVYIQEMNIFINFSLPIHSGNVTIFFEVQDSGGIEDGGLNSTKSNITILFLPSSRTPNALTMLTFDFKPRFNIDLAPNQEVAFMLNFGRQRTQDAFIVYRLLGCSDPSLFELQPQILGISSSSFDSLSSTDMALSSNVTYSSAVTDMTVAVRLAFKLAAYKVSSSECSVNVSDSFQNTAQFVIRIQTTFFNQPPSLLGTLHVIKQRHSFYQLVELHHPYSDQVITSVLYNVLSSPSYFNESGLISFNTSSVRFSFDEGRFRSFIGTLVLNVTLITNGLRSGQSAVFSNITIQVLYQNAPPSIIPLNVSEFLFVEILPGQNVVSFPAIIADLGEGESGIQELAMCFFASVENVALFKSTPMFTVFGNRANLTFDLKFFDRIPYDVAPVVFRNLYCIDNGGQEANGRSNAIDTLKVKLLFPPELPSFLNVSNSLLFTEFAFSGDHEDVPVVNGNAHSNQSGFFALNQESRRRGYAFVKFWVSQVPNHEVGFELSEIRFRFQGLPVNLNSFCDIVSVPLSHPVNAFDLNNLTNWRITTIDPSTQAAMNISCLRPLIFDSFAWAFGQEVDRHPLHWKLIGCRDKEQRDCDLLHNASYSNINVAGILPSSFSPEFYIDDESYLLSVDPNTGVANIREQNTFGVGITSRGIFLDSSEIGVKLHSFEASFNTFGIESGPSGAAKLSSMTFTVDDWQIISAIVEGTTNEILPSFGEQQVVCQGSPYSPAIRAWLSGTFILASNVTAPHVCLAMVTLKMVKTDGKWELFATISESRTAVGSYEIGQLAKMSNSLVFSKAILDLWTSASPSRFLNPASAAVVNIRVRQVSAVARHGGGEYRVPIIVFSRDLLYGVGTSSLSYTSFSSDISPVIGSQIPCERGFSHSLSGSQEFICHFIVLLNRFGKCNVTFLLSDSAGSVIFSTASSFKQLNSPPRMFCSVPFANFSLTTALVPNTVQIPGFCKGISAGNSFENDSQYLQFSVSTIFGQRIVSHVGLSPNGTLSLSLIPLLLGQIVFNLTVADSGGRDFGALNVWSHTAQVFVTSNSEVNRPPFASLFFDSKPVRGFVDDVVAFVNVTACAGPGDESAFQKSEVTFLVCTNGLLLGDACSPTFVIVRSMLLGMAQDLISGLLCPLWGLEYRIPRFFYGTSVIAANVTDEFGLSFLLRIPVHVEYVNLAPEFDIQPRNVEIVQPEGLISVMLHFFSVNAGHEDVGQSVNFSVIAENPSQFSHQPSISDVTYSNSETASAMVSFTVPLESIGKNITLLIFASDNGGTLHGGRNISLFRKFNLILLPVNKPPRFSLARQAIVVSEGTSQLLQIYKDFALNISAGQPAEHLQLLRFQCDTVNLFLFEIQPSISYDGTLTFKIASNTFGESNVTVHLFEIGADESRYSSFFMIFVNRSYDAPAILSLSSAHLDLQEGCVNEFDKFVFFTTESNLPSSVQLKFNVSILLNKSAPFFLTNPNDSLINASVTSEGKLLISCARKSWGQVLVGVSLVQTVMDNEVASAVSLSDLKVFSVFVAPVNDPPSFSLKSDLIVISQLLSSFESSNFIQNIDVGSSDEKEVISQIYCISMHHAIKHVIVVSDCLNKSSCPSASLSFDLVPYSQGFANVTCCVVETPSETCLQASPCSSVTCQQFGVLIPAVLHLVSKGDINIYQNDSIINDYAVVYPSQILVISPKLGGQIIPSVTSSDACSRLFVRPPSAAVSNSSSLDMVLFPSPFYGECSITVTVSLLHDAGTDISSVTFMIRVLRTNQVPLFSIMAPTISILENSGNHLFVNFVSNISAGFGDSDQGFFFVIEEVPNTSNRFSSSQVFALKPFIDLTGRLVFNISPFVHGAFIFTVRLSDVPAATDLNSRNSSVAMFYINVLPVNDRPVFTLKSQILTFLSSSQPTLETRTIFQSISAGPNEDDQNLSCSIQGASLSQNEMFVVPPIFAVGTFSLKVQVAPHAKGVAVYSVVCFDDGKSLYGQNQSVPANIIIEILRPNALPFFQLSQSVFAINSSTNPSTYSFQPALYSPSREYVKNSISQFSIQLFTGNSSLSTVITKNSRAFDPLTLLLPWSVRHRIADYKLIVPSRGVNYPQHMFVSEKSESFFDNADYSVVSVWKIQNGSFATKIFHIEDGMVHFSHFVQSYVFSRKMASCAISSAVDSGLIFVFVSIGCGTASSISHSSVPTSNFSVVVADFAFNRLHVHQKRVVSRDRRFNGTILGNENGIRYYGAVGAMMCSPTSGVLLLNNSAVAIRSLSTQFSVSVWFAVASFLSDNPLVSASKSSDDNLDRGWNLVVTRQRQLKFSVSIMDGSIGKFVTAISASNLVVPQKWTHVVASFSGRSIDLYVNGVLVASNIIPETVFFRSVVYSQVTILSDSDSDISVFVGATYEGVVISKFHGVISSCVMYTSASFESDVVYLFNSGSFMTNRFIDMSENLFTGNSSSVSTEHMLSFANVSMIEHALNQPMINAFISFEIICMSQVVSGNCSVFLGGLFVRCPLVPNYGTFSESCRDAPFYLLLNESTVLASSFISTVTIRYSSFVMISSGPSSNFQLLQDFADASGSTGSASASLGGIQYLFFAVANGGADVPISPAYVLQGQQYQRKSSLDVRVAAVSAVATLTHDYSRSDQNQVIPPCMYVAYASLTDTSFVYKYSGFNTNVSLVQIFVVPFIGGATSVSISKAGTKYGSDVALVSFCGIKGCHIFLLMSTFSPSVRSVFNIDAEAVWMFPSSKSSHVFILASFSTNTSSYQWDSAIFDASHDALIGISKSPLYVSNASAVTASFSFVGSQDLLFLGLSNIQAVFKYDAIISVWTQLVSFSSPSAMSTSVVMKDPQSSRAIYLSAFASPDMGIRVLTANISISQGAEFVRQLQSCDNTQSLYILRSLATGMVELTSVISWFNVSTGSPILIAELSQRDSMSLLGAYKFAVDCESGYLGVAHSGGISIIASNHTSQTLQNVNLISPSSSIFGFDLLSVSAIAFASFPGHLPVLVASSRDRGSVNTFTLSILNGEVHTADGSFVRDGQFRIDWLTRSSTSSVSPPLNRSLPFWNKSIKSFYSFLSSGKTFAVLLGKCNDPMSKTPALLIEHVDGKWIFRQELPGTLGACVASTCEQVQGSSFLVIGVNSFGDSLQRSIIFQLSAADSFPSWNFLQYVHTMAVVDIASYSDSGKCSYILIQKTDGLLPSGSLPPKLLDFDADLGFFHDRVAFNTTAYSSVASHVWKTSRFFILSHRKCWTESGLCYKSLSISTRLGDGSFQELAALPCSEISSMSSLIFGDLMIIALSSRDGDSTVFRFDFQSSTLMQTGSFPRSFGCILYRLGPNLQLVFLDDQGLGFRRIVNGNVEFSPAISDDFIYGGLSDELKSRLVFQHETWNYNPDSAWKLQLQHSSLGDILLVLDASDGAIDTVIAMPSVISLRGPASMSVKHFSNFSNARFGANLMVFSVSPYKVTSFQVSRNGLLQFEFASNLTDSLDLLNADLAFDRSETRVDLFLYNKGGSNFEEDQVVSWSATVIAGSQFVEKVTVQETVDQIGPARFELRSKPRAFGTSVVQLSIFDKFRNNTFVDVGNNSKFVQNLTFHFNMAPPVTVLSPNIVVAVNSTRKFRVDKVLSFDSSLSGLSSTYRVTVANVSNPAMFSSPPVLDMQGSLFFGTTFVDSSSDISVLVRWLDSSLGSLSTSLMTRVRFIKVNRPPVPVAILNISMSDQQDRYSPAITSFANVVSCAMSFDGKDVNQTLNPFNPYQYRFTTVDGIVTPDNMVFHVSPVMFLNGTLQFALIPSVYGIMNVYFTAQDTGGTEMGGIDTSDVFSIHVRRVPAVDPPLLFLPSFAFRIDGSASCNYASTCPELMQPIRPPMYGVRILQDSGLSTIQCLVRPGYSRSSVSISRAMAQANDMNITNVSITVNGLLTLQPARGFFGSAVIELFLEDSMGSSSIFPVPVHVINVNEPPTISVMSNIQLQLLSSGPPVYNVPGFVISSSVGSNPLESSAQSIVSVMITRDSSSSISLVANPVYNIRTGILTFQTVPGAVGILKLKVVAFDSSDFCCSDNFSSAVFADIVIQDPPQIAAIVPDIISPSGGITLSVIGRYFTTSLSRSVSVFVGASECVDAVIVSDAIITCTAPPGLGLKSVSVYLSATVVRSATLPDSVTYASFIYGGSHEESDSGLGFWGVASATSSEPSQDLNSSSATRNSTVSMPSRQLLQTAAVNGDSRVTSPVFAIALLDRFEGLAGASATISFVPSRTLPTGGSITIQFPLSFFDTEVIFYSTSPGSSTVPSLSVASSFSSNTTLVLTTISSFGGNSGGRIVAGTIFTITLSGIRMGRARTATAAMEEIFFSTSVDTLWSIPVVCGPIYRSLRESRISVHPAVTLAKANLTISFVPTSVVNFHSVIVTLTGFSSSSNPLSVTNLVGFLFFNGASATSSLFGGVLTVEFTSTNITSHVPVSFQVNGVTNSAKARPSVQSIYSATRDVTGSILDSTIETEISALESSLIDVVVNLSSSVAGTESSIIVSFASYSIVSLAGGSITVTLTGFKSSNPLILRSFFGFLDVPSATASLNSGILIVQFSSGSLRPGHSTSFVVENIKNPQAPQPASNDVSAALIGFTAIGSSATENTDHGYLAGITPSLLELDVRLNSSVAGASVTASISFTPMSMQKMASFVVTLTGFSAALGFNPTVAFVPVDGLGFKVGEGFVGFNISSDIPVANATIVDSVLTVLFISGSFLPSARATFAVSALVSPQSPQSALNSLRASTFSLSNELLDATDAGKLSSTFGPPQYLATLPPIDPSFLLSLEGQWSGTCSAFAGLSATRPDLGTVCSPVPVSAACSVRYNSASQTYTTFVNKSSLRFPLYPNMDKSLSSFSAESFTSVVQITSARDGSLKGVISGKKLDVNSSRCTSVVVTGTDSLVEWGWGELGSPVPQLQKCGPSLPLPRSMCSSSAGLYSYVCTLSRIPDSLGVPTSVQLDTSEKSFNVSENSVLESPIAYSIGGPLTAAALTAVWGGAGRGVYIGGNFKRAGNSPFTHYIAQWYGGSYLPLAYGLDGPVNSLAIDNQFLYVGGSFSRAFQSSDSIVHSGPILKWHTSQRVYMTLFSCDQASTLESHPPIRNAVVSSIALHDGGVAFAGRFASVCNRPAGNVAFVSRSGLLVLLKGGVSGGHVVSLGSLGTDLYVGGHFTMAGSVPAQGIARWDGKSWNALGGGVVRGSVQAIAILGSTVFIAGNFDSVDGGRLVTSGVAAWVDFSWKIVGGGILGSVHSLAVMAPCVVAGGSFRVGKNSSNLGLARLCGKADLWEPIFHAPGSSSEK